MTAAREPFSPGASSRHFTAGMLLGPLSLMAVVAVIAASVRFTLPAFDRDTSSCAVPSVDPLSDLDSVFVWMQPRGATGASLVFAASVRGREGQSMSITIPTDSVATVWVETSDTGGNRSCPSNHVGVNLTLAVPGGPPPFPSGTEWFDIAGRRVPRPRTPGVYFARRGRGQPMRVVVVR